MKNFSKIDSPGGVAAVPFEMRRLEKVNIISFVLIENHRNAAEDIILCKNYVSGIKSD